MVGTTLSWFLCPFIPFKAKRVYPHHYPADLYKHVTFDAKPAILRPQIRCYLWGKLTWIARMAGMSLKQGETRLTIAWHTSEAACRKVQFQCHCVTPLTLSWHNLALLLISPPKLPHSIGSTLNPKLMFVSYIVTNRGVDYSAPWHSSKKKGLLASLPNRPIQKNTWCSILEPQTG